jgi:drug/metabolite transporter (DMT)-like permease
MSNRSDSVVLISLPVIGAFAGIYIVWGTTYLAMAIAIQTVPPFISGAARFLLAGALMYGWLRLRAPSPLAGINMFGAALCGVLLTGIGNGLVIWSQQGIPSGIVALVVTAMPVIVLVLDWAFFSKRAPTAQGLAGTAIAIAGVATIIVHTRSLSGDAHPLHLIALMVAICGWSIGTLMQKRYATIDNVLSFTCAQLLFGGLFQLSMSIANKEWIGFEVSHVSLASILAVAYLIVFGTLIALNCYLWLLTHVPAQKVTTYALVNPVVALILGAIVLNERITWLAMVAALLVLAGVALVLFQDWSPVDLWRRQQRKRIAVGG